MSFISKLLEVLGTSAASTGTQGCWTFLFDEPKMPKSLIEK
jgi:cyclic lactone autoinducer peptide